MTAATFQPHKLTSRMSRRPPLQHAWQVTQKQHPSSCRTPLSMQRWPAARQGPPHHSHSTGMVQALLAAAWDRAATGKAAAACPASAAWGRDRTLRAAQPTVVRPSIVGSLVLRSKVHCCWVSGRQGCLLQPDLCMHHSASSVPAGAALAAPGLMGRCRCTQCEQAGCQSLFCRVPTCRTRGQCLQN